MKTDLPGSCHSLEGSTVRTQLDEANFEAAWAEGQAMTLEQVVAYALEE